MIIIIFFRQYQDFATKLEIKNYRSINILKADLI